MVYTLVMKHRDCDAACHPYCQCPAPDAKQPWPIPAGCPCTTPPPAPAPGGKCDFKKGGCKECKVKKECNTLDEGGCHWCDGDPGPVKPGEKGYCATKHSPCPKK